MPKISACIISFNEAEKIADCLKSLKGLVDEIVVVDSGSADATRQIAADHGARVVEQAFLGYIAQKQFATDQASYDWVLSIDCDERISAELRDTICARRDRLDERTVYRMARRNFYIYRWLNHCWYPDRKVRLFNRRQAHWGGTNPHDHVITESGRIEDLDGDILHYSFDSISDHMDMLERFTEIASREAFARGKRATVIDPLLHGTTAFTKQYFLKLGFLDGFAGLTVSTLSGVYAFVKYVKLWMLALPGRMDV